MGCEANSHQTVDMVSTDHQGLVIKVLPRDVYTNPPVHILLALVEIARDRKCTYTTIDIAEAANGNWFVLEAGDGGVSGPATAQDFGKLREHWADIANHFS